MRSVVVVVTEVLGAMVAVMTMVWMMMVEKRAQVRAAHRLLLWCERGVRAVTASSPHLQYYLLQHLLLLLLLLLRVRVVVMMLLCYHCF